MEDSEAVIQQQNREDFGKSEYGCEHYKRRCKLRAPCCGQIFSCRHCHNAATSALSNPKDRHELVRRDVSQVICAVCNTEQQVAHVCSKCGVKMGAYFCEICRFYDDDTTKEQFHCDDCGICRVGGRERFFHCKKCGKRSDYLPGYAIIRLLAILSDETARASFGVGWVSVGERKRHWRCSNVGAVPAWVCWLRWWRKRRTASCYSVDLLDNHLCVENSMKNHCPICYEYLFDSVQSTRIMRCGHTMHTNCFDDMLVQNQYRCPICSKSLCNMSRAWERLDEEIEGTAMPEEYHHEVQILCNDCNSRSEAFFHIFGHKCRHCNSYNTRVI
ncbi:hypothetical protein RHSIM_Rhsim13G0016300 [Rhododendron simsii]|uniref:Uncharacterized protein n=1 Tax=Rhododendron simsii TaxID=118357 RepID=A0A834L6G8_RHOSS|nr:hypothetical protein RHSIM_Rhsim13G0016300 [Rhododendron simsii]